MDLVMRLHIPAPREAIGYWKAALLLAVLALTLVWPGGDALATGGGNSITTPDSVGTVGLTLSLVLDANDKPVISYWDSTNGDLELLHCGNPTCTSGNSFATVDTGGASVVGAFSSVALDANGYPVISYTDNTSTELKVAHCDDANCSGGGESIETPDVGDVGGYTSIVLDASGYPVVSYYEATATALRVLHCGDANCASGNTIATPDSTGNVGTWTSLRLDSSGYPVVAYHDHANRDLKLLHCDDANCLGDESANVATPDPDGLTDSLRDYTSLVLDSNGYPVVTYFDLTNLDLKVLHCGNPTCSAGNSITTPDTPGGQDGDFATVVLDSNGYPVIAYNDIVGDDLRVMRCNDASCSGSDEGIESPDTGGDVGWWTSVALDSGDRPVVAYYDVTNSALKVLRCGDPACTGKGTSGISITNVFQDALPKTCFDVMDSGQQVLFTVCDNDFQDGFPVSHAACDDGNDTICNDEDPALGSVTITVDPAVYHVEVGKTPLNITASTAKGVCSGGPTCTLTFTNTSDARPWNPWDVAGPGGSWPPDGVIDLPNDILGVILHFCPIASDPCAKP